MQLPNTSPRTKKTAVVASPLLSALMQDQVMIWGEKNRALTFFLLCVSVMDGQCDECIVFFSLIKVMSQTKWR